MPQPQNNIATAILEDLSKIERLRELGHYRYQRGFGPSGTYPLADMDPTSQVWYAVVFQVYPNLILIFPILPINGSCWLFCASFFFLELFYSVIFIDISVNLMVSAEIA